MRAIKNRRDTVDSSKSNDTFKTANSDLEVIFIFETKTITEILI
jgi:hypothetical protein